MKAAVQYIEDTYNQEYIEEAIFEAIKPGYCQVMEKGNAFSLESSRAIEWDPISSWLAKIEERGFDVTQESGEYNPLLVSRDEHAKPYLTMEGVRLLLWDLGIFEGEEEAP